MEGDRQWRVTGSGGWQAVEDGRQWRVRGDNGGEEKVEGVG